MRKVSLFRSSGLRFVVAALALVALFTNAALAAPTVLIAEGRTSVTLSGDFIGALSALQVSAGAVGAGSLRSGVASFPITGGALDLANAKAEINHSGGLSLSAGTTRVQLLSFNIDTTGTTPVLTGLVTVNGDVVGRLPLFNLTLPTLTLPLQPAAFGTIFIPGVQVRLSREAAGALNSIFGVTAFTEGFNIGTAAVQAVSAQRRLFTAGSGFYSNLVDDQPEQQDQY